MFAKRDKPGVGGVTVALRPPTGGEIRPPAPKGDRVPSIVAAGMMVQGDVASDGEVHVDGVVEGDITCAEVTIGRDGRVQGRVRASSVRIHGTMEGEIVGDRVEVTATGRVAGRIFLRTLEVQAGASYFCETRPVGEAPALAGTHAVAAAPSPSTPPVASAFPPTAED